MMKIHNLITTSDELAALCQRLAQSEFITVDTEFMRENTYWPELCLVQIANNHEAAAIDPSAQGINLEPLLELLTENLNVLKSSTPGRRMLKLLSI